MRPVLTKLVGQRMAERDVREFVHEGLLAVGGHRVDGDVEARRVALDVAVQVLEGDEVDAELAERGVDVPAGDGHGRQIRPFGVGEGEDARYGPKADELL